MSNVAEGEKKDGWQRQWHSQAVILMTAESKGMPATEPHTHAARSDPLTLLLC